VYAGYNAALAAGSNTVTVLQSDLNSYKSKLSAAQGALGNAINIATRPNTEISLASLINGTATSVTQNLYSLAGTTAGSKGVFTTAIITTYADGRTNVSATPIPPAFFLMGSGLLGMFGLRRKNKVA
jgi:hypothetical protein